MNTIWYLIAISAILIQPLLALNMWRQYRSMMKKFRKKPGCDSKDTAVIIPCKGIDKFFDANIRSFFHLVHPCYRLWFVVESKNDPAFESLEKIIEEESTSAREVKIHIAGFGEECSQKIHNLLYAYRNLPPEVQNMAFADSDICVNPNWLLKLLHPLRKSKIAASSGYRWFVPLLNNSATIVAACLNAKVAQLLGNSRFDLAWGGSMAISVDMFRNLKIEKLWQTALSDDYSLSYAVKKQGLRVEYVPNCLVPSYELYDWKSLAEFARRQFLITRIYNFRTWLLALFGNSLSILHLWVTAAIAVLAFAANSSDLWLFVLAPAVTFFSHLTNAIYRKKMVENMLSEQKKQLMKATRIDICFFWLWPVLMLAAIISSAFGNQICWRGIKYKLVSPTETRVLKFT